ncbi:hypothetical protein Asi03nite_14830 [Actinoplanes siamensis]|uniref:Putative sensor domain-containing protein n=2 Tax=Actinoplanes siamensis TaxID=1223317 RepID=A0A919N3Y8_9ACTN|nr:hypothetical protein Asi03nite_14830 [Actinoplanes siamensis]
MMFAFGMSRGFADHERERISAALGEPVTRPDYRASDSSNALRRLATVLGDRQSWRDLAHAALRSPPGGVAFSMVATWWAGLVGGLTWRL